ncbi:esterase-like [Gastrolobium bilobum]|uniref:esterase-like n=1 Tax=Gastrolobium bilobum TaxID=150636 RepID=UPI002AB105A3|nr:esterase-like [Gastrolobium bilobum]
MYPMEFPSTTKFHISLVSLLVLSSAATIILNPVFATKDCDFPAIFNFGDSNSDTAYLAASFYAPTPPYGETYFHRPAGRFSDGRLIIDFIAQSFGLPYLSAYLDSLGTNFSHGANFATAASTIRPPPSIIPQGSFSPFYFDVQDTQFRDFKPRTQFIRHQGGIFASLMPKEEYFPEALYTIDIGNNDLNAGCFGNLTVQQVNASVPDIVNSFSENVKNIYDLGARSFWIHNTGPLGCLPYILTKFLSAERDDYGCAKAYNEVAQYFNKELKDAVVQLRKDLPLAAFTYVDIYSVKYSLFSNPKKYGFEHPLIACCGYGGKYNYSGNYGSSIECGRTIEVNGTEIFVGSCERPSVRVNWDGIHYTEAANKFVFDQISTGAFSYPPLPLNMACHRNSTENN